MAAKLDDGPSGAISEINVTPFVDVVLVLLVIFMVTAPALMKDRIGLQLPKTRNSDAKGPPSLGIAVNRQGQILLNGQPVDDQGLQKAAAQAVAANPDVQALISADQDARHGALVHAIDLIKSGGLNRFALQVIREKP